jgi:hypothetical protein
LGKKSKSKAGNASAANSARIINILLVVGAVAFASGIIWYTMRETSETTTREALPKPNVSTLDPLQFSGRVRRAYEAAREVPEVLAQLPCYCGCMSNFGHRNNLDCFHDAHGVECTMCQDIAIEARDMWNNGFEITRIRQAIKDRHGRFAALGRYGGSNENKTLVRTPITAVLSSEF